MADENLVPVGIEAKIVGAEQATKSLSDLAATGGKAEAALHKTADASEALAAAGRKAIDASKGVADGLTQEVRAAEAVAVATKRASDAHRQMADAAGLNRMQSMELMHVVRSLADSMAAGMSPVRAFGMEGARIAQIFGSGSGGVAATLRATAAQLAPLVGTAGLIGLVAAPLVLLAVALMKGQSEANAFANAMKATGNAAGVTGDQFHTMVEQVGQIAGFGKAREALMAIASTGKVTGSTLQGLGEVSVRLSEITGESAAKTGAQWANMGDDVAAFAIKVNEQYHLITEVQYERIKLLQEEGQTAQAQAELIKDAQASLARRGEADLGILEKAWRGVAGAISEAWENIKKFGAGGDQGVKNQIDVLDAEIRNGSTGRNPLTKEALDSLQRERDGLALVLREHQFMTDQIAKENQVQQAGIQAAKDHAQQYATMGDNIHRANVEIQKYLAGQAAIRKANPNSPELDSPARVAQIEADIRKKYEQSLRTHTKQGPTDQTSSLDAAVARQIAEVDGQIAQAAKTELQARLALATSADQRFAIQRQIDQQDYAKQIADYEGKIAALDGQIATIMKTRKDAHAAAQVAELDTLKGKYQQLELDAEYTEHLKRLAANTASLDATLHEQIENKRVELETAQAGLQAQADLSRSAYVRAKIEAQITLNRLELQKLAAQEVLEAEKSTDEQKKRAQHQIDTIDKVEAAQTELAKRASDVAHAYQAMTRVGEDIVDAIKNHDWARLFDALAAAIEQAQHAFSQSGTAADKVGAVAGIAGILGNVIGGKAGKTISSAANGAVMGAKLGSMVPGVGTVVGAIAGAIVGGLSTLLSGKPSNNAAIAQINGDNVTLAGNKRTSETGDAATQVAQAVIQGQDLLKSIGATLGTTITAIDLGTRDPTHIHTSDGRELQSAMGDTKAAAETALKAVLDGATFTDEAEKKLVQSMEAAGAGFDQITVALQNYAAAQQVSSQLADQILQLTDPQAYDKKQVTDAIKAQRDALKAASAQGYYTADQLAALNAQLDQLQGLQLAEVLKKYGTAADDAATAQASASAALAGALEQAKSTLVDAVNAQASALNDTISTYQNLSTSLHGFLDNLKTAANPQASLSQAKASYQAVAGRTDTDSLGKLPAAAQAYLDAATASAHSQSEVARIQAQVRNAVQASANYADAEVSVAQQQLDALQAMEQQLGLINGSVLTVAQALANYQMVSGQQVKDPQWGPAANIEVNKALAAATGYAGAFGSGGFAAFISGASPDTQARARAILTAYGETNRIGFATGGSVTPSGSSTGDRIPMTWMMNGGETAYVSRADVMQRVAAAMERQNTLLEQQNTLIANQGRAIDDGNKLMRKVSLGGTSLRTTVAA